MSDPVVRREEVEAALEARRELGRTYEPEIVDSLVEKIERRLDQRQQSGPPERRPQPGHGPETRLALGSIALGVGATAVILGDGPAWLVVFVWISIAVVNVAYALRR